MNSKLALMPLLIMSAFSYAADEATPETPVQQQLQEVNVRADAKRVKAARRLHPERPRQHVALRHADHVHH